MAGHTSHSPLHSTHACVCVRACSSCLLTRSQRCNDLLEVCEAQLQFAPRTALPVFGGTKGPEVRKSILDIQAAFKRLVDGLRSLDINILDVKATR